MAFLFDIFRIASCEDFNCARTKVTNYAYNEFNQTSSITNALNQVTKFGYNKNGASNKVIFPKGDSITSAFDALNQLSSVSYNGVQKWGYSYDDNSNLTLLTATAGSNTIKTGYTYNELNQPTTLAHTFNLAAPVTQAKFVYDERGNVISVSHTNGTYTAYE